MADSFDFTAYRLLQDFLYRTPNQQSLPDYRINIYDLRVGMPIRVRPMFSGEWIPGALVRWDESTFLDGVPTQQIWVRSLDTSNRDRIRPYYPRFNEVWHPDSPEPVDGAHDPAVRAIYLHARLVLTPVLAATRPRDDRTSAPETRAVWIPALYLKPAQHATKPARHTVLQLTLADNTAAVVDVRHALSVRQFKASALWGRARTLLDAPYALVAPDQSAAAIATLDDLYPLPRRLSHARLPVYRPPPARAALTARAGASTPRRARAH